MMMATSLLRLVIPLPPNIHTIIRTFCEVVLLLPVVRDDGTVDGARVVLGDTADDDAVGAGGGAGVCLVVLEDGEFEVGFLGVGEGEVLEGVSETGVWLEASGLTS